MIEAWLNLPTPAMVGCVALFFFSFAALLVWIAFASPIRTWVQSFNGVVAPFFGSISIILALMFSMLASDVWDRVKRAQNTVQQERNSLHTLVTFSESADAPQGLGKAVWDYIKAVVEHDWPQMAEQQPTPEGEAALDALMRNVLLSSPTQNARRMTIMVGAAESLRNARQARLVLGNQSVDGTRWATVLILAMLTQMGLALVHLDRRRAQAASLCLFTTAIVIVFALVALYEYPFSPPFNISADPLKALAARLPPLE